MPELPRRAGFTAAVVALTAAFGLSLSGIADTRGSLRPDGEAAAVAAKQRAERAAEQRCPRPQRDATADEPV